MQKEDQQLIEALYLRIEDFLNALTPVVAGLSLLHSQLWLPGDTLQEIRISVECISREMMHWLAKAPENLYTLHPRRFEELIAKLLEDQGYEVVLTPKTRDGGHDLFASYSLPTGRVLTLVECKRWLANRKVSIQIVRQLYGVLSSKRATNALLATTSFFTKDAEMFVNSVKWQMSLRDRDGIVSWLEKYRKVSQA